MKPALAHSLSHIYSIKWSLGFQKPQQMSQDSLTRLRAIYKKCALRPFWQISHKLSRENVSHGLYWENHHICRAQLRHLAGERGWFYGQPPHLKPPQPQKFDIPRADEAFDSLSPWVLWQSHPKLTQCQRVDLMVSRREPMEKVSLVCQCLFLQNQRMSVLRL